MMMIFTVTGKTRVLSIFLPNRESRIFPIVMGPRYLRMELRIESSPPPYAHMRLSGIYVVRASGKCGTLFLLPASGA